MNIYYSDLEVVVHKQVPSYSLSNLMCDVGGTLGLWAGISIISCLEVIELVAKLIMSRLYIKKKIVVEFKEGNFDTMSESK